MGGGRGCRESGPGKPGGLSTGEDGSPREGQAWLPERELGSWPALRTGTHQMPGEKNKTQDEQPLVMNSSYPGSQRLAVLTAYRMQSRLSPC